MSCRPAAIQRRRRPVFGVGAVGWVQLQGMDSLGHLLEVEVKVKRDLVEWWLNDRSIAMMDRERLASWLQTPTGIFDTHEVALWFSRWGPVISIEGTPRPSILDPEAFARLHSMVRLR